MVQNQTSQATRQSAPMSLTGLKQELLKIAEEYGYPESLIPSILNEPELMKDIVTAHRNGRETNTGWVMMTLTAY